MPARALVLLLAVAACTAGVAAPPARPAPDDTTHRLAAVTFDSQLLAGRARGSDLSAYRRGGRVEPGIYALDLYVNDQWQAERRLRFIADSAHGSARPCFKRADLLTFGVAESALDETAKSSTACRGLTDWLPDARARFDAQRLRYDITIPQADRVDTPRGAVPRQAWRRGITAGLLQYNLDTFQSHTDALGVSRYAFLGLTGGFNLGGWRFRSDENLQWRDDGGFDNDNVRSYALRPLPAIRSELTLGDGFTDGQLFDTYGYRGVSLASDDRMLARSQSGYAPVVRGEAQTNALVEVEQNGQQIYHTTVPPGPFVIDDLYPTGYGGDLEVTVTEADGRVHRFSVPYASVPSLLRAGITRYELTAGQFRESGADDPWLFQATLQHGFANALTGYAGAIGSDVYAAALLGGALNTPLGAWSLDVTYARSRFRYRPTEGGESYRLTFSRSLADWGTNFSLAAYRYATSGYYELDTALRLRGDEHRAGLRAVGFGQERNRGQITVNQDLGARWGTLYVTGSIQDYWDQGGTTRNYQLGYNNQYRRVAYGVSVVRSRDLYRGQDTQYTLSFSIPFDRGPQRSIFSNGSLGLDDNGYQSSRLGVSGTSGANAQVSWNAAVNDRRDGATSGSAGLAWRSPVSTLRASGSDSPDFRQISLGAQGAVVAHRGGLTFSPQRGDNMILVHAPGATGARILNTPGARIDDRGYGLVAFATPYRANRIRLDPSTIPADVALQTTSQQIAPWAGAVAELDFPTDTGQPVLVHLSGDDGRALPLGAEVYDATGERLGPVGQGGQFYFRSRGGAGPYHVSVAGQRICRFVLSLPAPAKPATHGELLRRDARCHR